MQYGVADHPCPALVISAGELERRKADGEWICAVCTLLNSPESPACEECGALFGADSLWWPGARPVEPFTEVPAAVSDSVPDVVPDPSLPESLLDFETGALKRTANALKAEYKRRRAEEKAEKKKEEAEHKRRRAEKKAEKKKEEAEHMRRRAEKKAEKEEAGGEEGREGGGRAQEEAGGGSGQRRRARTRHSSVWWFSIRGLSVKSDVWSFSGGARAPAKPSAGAILDEIVREEREALSSADVGVDGEARTAQYLAMPDLGPEADRRQSFQLSVSLGSSGHEPAGPFPAGRVAQARRRRQHPCWVGG